MLRGDFMFDLFDKNYTSFYDNNNEQHEQLTFYNSSCFGKFIVFPAYGRTANNEVQLNNAINIALRLKRGIIISTTQYGHKHSFTEAFDLSNVEKMLKPFGGLYLVEVRKTVVLFLNNKGNINFTC